MNSYKILPFCFLFIFAKMYAQPQNDDCNGLINLGTAPTCPTTIYNNIAATPSTIDNNPSNNIPNCFNNGNVARDVWFAFQTPIDGSITDFTITVTGVSGMNSPMLQPQFAIYRGDCEINSLQELECVSANLGEASVNLNIMGLTPGLTYFLRINDWSTGIANNAGDFTICVEELISTIIMGTIDNSSLCNGTLVDSGGETGDYGNAEDFVFTICPNQVHECININIIEYNMELGFDILTFYEGADITAPQIFQVTGFGTDFDIQSSSDCITIQFTSDDSFSDSGFLLNWECTAAPCTIPPVISCDEPVIIPSLPYQETGISTCFAGNTFTQSACGNDIFLAGEEYIFTYDSPGDECISVFIRNSNIQTGLGIYNDCPEIATNCIAAIGGTLGISEPSLEGIFLETAGTYYIAVGNSGSCTPFDINVEKVDCPTTLPNANTCENALGINGCDNLPAIINVNQSAGNEDFIQAGVNDGCWADAGPAFFTWFVFQAQTNGEFGFLANNSDPDENSDIDINVWGPFDAIDEICEATINSQPIRSTFADDAGPGNQDLTGLTNFHPNTNNPITDDCEFEDGDGFVRTISVNTGEWYIVLVNDYNGNILEGGIGMDFSPTTAGVLAPIDNNFQITADTSVCAGSSIPLSATGADLYQWQPNPALSCLNCSDPIVTINQADTFEVVVFTACFVDTLSVVIDLLSLDLGEDLTLCLNEELQLDGSLNLSDLNYTWTGNIENLSCLNCPDPLVNNTSSGTYEYTLSATNDNCNLSDTLNIEVLDSPAPTYNINNNQAICLGTTLSIGGDSIDTNTYIWTNIDDSFLSNNANPSVSPNQTSTYYLEVNNGICPFSVVDSVVVEVFSEPSIQVIENDTICLGESITLGMTIPDNTVNYAWMPSTNLNQPNIANPIASPAQTITYYLEANNLVCPTQVDSVTIVVIDAPNFSLPPDTMVCIAEELLLPFSVNFPGNTTWSPTSNLTFPDGLTPVFLSDTSGVFSYTVNYNNSCGVDTNFQINVLAYPIPNLIAVQNDISMEPVFEGTPVTLTAVSNDQNLNYFWSTGQTGATIILNPLVENFPGPDSTASYELILENEFGCQFDTLISFKITNESPLIPNVFTPNNDGQNDVFRLVKYNEAITIERFEIWSRWGERVFSTSNNNQGWDGKIDGKAAPDDVYLYQIILTLPNGLRRKLSGDVTLLR